jgi:hypothetical protein
MEGWLVTNWFNALSAVSIVGGLLFTADSIRSDAHARRVGNLLTLTRNHRQLWAEVFRYPKLGRVLDPSADLSSQPMTRDERIFVNMVIQHLGSSFQAMKKELTVKPEGASEDVGEFFSLPIPRAVWEKSKRLQNDDFAKFVEECLTGTEDPL